MCRSLTCVVLLSWGGVTLGFCSVAGAQARVEKVLLMPDFGAEELRVVNRLGMVEIEGWDRPEIRVRALKQAVSPEVAEQLRVEVTRQTGQRLLVGTFVRVRPALAPPARHRLYALLERQQQLLQAMVWGRGSTRADTDRMRAIGRELARLRPPDKALVVQPVDLSLPVERARVDLRISVPRQLRIRARTLTHDLLLRGCHAGADLSTESGSIVVQDAGGGIEAFAPRAVQRFSHIGGSLTVEGGSGDVILRQIDGGVRVLLVSGAIDAEGVRAPTAELRTIGGQICLSAPLADKARYDLISLRGDLIVKLPLRASARLDGRASRWDFGRFRPKQVRRQQRHVEAALGTGTQRQLRLSTGTGAVKLVALDGT